MTNRPDTVPASAAGTDSPDPHAWVAPLPTSRTIAREPAQAWRSWLGGEPAGENDDLNPDSEGDTESSTPTASAPLVDFDDPMAPIVSEMYARRAARRHRLTSRMMLGSAAALAAAAAVGWLVLAPDTSTNAAAGVAPASVPSTTTAAGTTPVPPAWCHPVNSAGLVVSDSAGDLSSGPGAILAQQFSLYVRRDVAAVRAVFAPDAVAASEDATRAAIDATPVGTKHCVSIHAAGPDRWTVQISERRPDGSTPHWSQTITTATQADGRVLITAITAGGA